MKSSIAKDNGRTTEFIRRKDYPDKSLCFECGQEGHLSYQCEKNTLGPRTPPPKKVRVRNKNKDKCEADTSYYDSDSEDGLRRPQEPSNRCSSDSDEADTLSSAIKTEVSILKTIELIFKFNYRYFQKMFAIEIINLVNLVQINLKNFLIFLLAISFEIY